jgi:hypothetical protein
MPVSIMMYFQSNGLFLHKWGKEMQKFRERFRNFSFGLQ